MTLPMFEDVFEALTGHRPRAYQVELARRMSQGALPNTLDVPTGMGKTLAAVVAWFYSLAVDLCSQSGERAVPMRLHLISDRRVVVDDTFLAADRVRLRLSSAADGPLEAVAAALREALGLAPEEDVLEVLRIRGGLVDADRDAGAVANGLPRRLTEHTRFPARPAVVVGTLDMVCSRLLFRGYQLSAARRSIDAGLTGSDTWWVLDEAHLAPQAVRTLSTLENAGGALLGELSGTIPALRVMAMTATPVPEAVDVLGWDESAEMALDSSLGARMAARAEVPFEVELVDGSATPALVQASVDLLENLQPGQSVVVFSTKVSTAKAVRRGLDPACQEHGVGIELLTGGMPELHSRGVIERLAPFRTGAPERTGAAPVIVVATSTLEVGADLDFTHLVTESADASALIQRFGRVNRIGARRDGSVHVVHSRTGQDPVYGDAASSAIAVLDGARSLGAAVVALREAPASARVLTQEPVTIPPTVVGAYVRTAGSRNDPPVSPWIRALEDPRGEVVVVARTGTRLMSSDWGRALLDDLVEEPPDARAEGWTVRLGDLRDVLPILLKAGPVVVLDPTSAREPRIFESSTGSDSVSPGSVLVVETTGLGAALGIPDAGCDLSDRVVLPGATIAQVVEALGTDRVARGTTVLTDLGAEVDGASAEEAEDLLLELVESMRDEVDGVLTVDLLGSESVHPWLRLRLATPAAESVERAVALEAHSDDVARLAERWARVLGLPAGVVEDIRLAGYWHDAGKGASELFQAALRMSEGADGWLGPGPSCDAIPLAKSALPRRLHRRSQALAGVPSGWRHEALSAELLDEAIAEGVVVPHDAELVRHLVLSHHGHFRGAGPVLTTPTQAVPCAYQDPRDPRWLDRPGCFRDLNDRYGIYGLALMEAVVRLSDWEASRKEQLDD